MEAVTKINRKRNNKRSPSIWSPIAHLLNLRLSAIGSTIRANLKSDLKPLKTLIAQLQRDESLISLNEDERDWLDDNSIQSEPFDWSDWINLFHDSSHAAREIIRIRKLLSAENRKEFRRLHGDKMMRIQEQADAGRIGGVINHIMGTSSSFTMESIRQGDEIITDGPRIASLVTAFFAKWFSRLPEEKERGKKLADCVLNADRPSWDKLIDDTRIPMEVGNTLWQAFQPRPLSLEGRKEAEDLVNYTPSLEEFVNYISYLNPRSAPGFSGLSYLMVKLWPDSVIERSYECLVEAWTDKRGLVG